MTVSRYGLVKGYGPLECSDGPFVTYADYAALEAAAATRNAEMRRYLPVLERLQADPAAWERFTSGLGIATINGYTASLKGEKP